MTNINRRRFPILFAALAALALAGAVSGLLLSPVSPVQAQNSAGICDRTEQVRVAILAKLFNVNDCSAVTESDLGGIRGDLMIFRKEIRTLKDGDFDGLTSLGRIYLHSNELEDLPPGIFDELTSLTVLSLESNNLETLSAGIFDELTNMESLFLSSNQLGELRSDVFSELAGLRALLLDINSLDELPADVFDGLTKLEALDLANNDLEELPADVFDALDNLERLDLGSNSLDELPADVFDGLTKLETLHLSNNELDELPADVFDGLASLEYLTLFLNDLDELPSDVFDDLTNLERLLLSHNDLEELPSDVFDSPNKLETLDLSMNRIDTLQAELLDGLANLVSLNLAYNHLLELSSDSFDGLPKLTTLNLAANWLETLPSDIFDGAAKLETLSLWNNRLETLPTGMFAGLSSLESVSLQGNPGTPFTFTVQPEQRGDESFVVKVTEGAPLDMEIILSAESGTLSTSIITIQGGSVESDEISVTRLGEVSVESAVFTNYTSVRGIQPGLGAQLSMRYPAPAPTPPQPPEPEPTGGICDRTREVIAVILSKLPDIDECTEVAESHLSAITRLPSFDQLDSSVPYLRSGDFRGLSNVELVYLSGTNLAEVEENTFDGLTSLVSLYLSHNDLHELPPDVFDALTNLERLLLSNNDLEDMPSDVLDNLVNLEVLLLDENELSALKSSWFDNLDKLENLDVSDNDLTTLDDALFDNLTRLETLDLSNTGLTTLERTWFDDLHQLEKLRLGYNDLALDQLPDDFFDVLPNLKVLSLAGIGKHPKGPVRGGTASMGDLSYPWFASLSNLKGLDLIRNGLSELPGDFLDGFPDLRNLQFTGNSLTALEADAFHGVPNLRELQMSSNSITELPAGVFDGLHELEKLNLGGNSLSELPGSLFKDLRSLGSLLLHSNDLNELPANAFVGLNSLHWVALQDNPGAPFVLTAELVRRGPGEIAVKVVAGVPFPMLVTLSAQGGTLDNVETLTTRINAGTTTSDVIRVTPAVEGQTQVTISVDSVEFGKVPFLDGPPIEPSIQGVQLGLGDDLILAFPTVENRTATGLPAISGTTQVGETLTTDTSGIADADGLNNVQYEHQWLADDTAITGATGSAYTLTDSEGGKAIKVRVRFTDDGGNEETLTSAATAAVAARPTTPLNKPDAPTGSLDGAGNASLDWNDVETATGYEVGLWWGNSWTTLPETSANIGVSINGSQATVTGLPTSWTVYFFRVRAINGIGASDWSPLSDVTLSEITPNSPATGLPRITGTVQVGETITVDTTGIADPDGLTNPPFTYQWTADDTDVAGATGLSYILADADEGKAITVTVSFTDDAGHTETRTSTQTAAVEARANSAGICDRPQQVIDAILDNLSRGNCAQINTSDLESVTGTLNLGNKGLTAAPSGTFDGLTNLEKLYLSLNGLEELPADLFDGLDNLEHLDLNYNRLEELPAGLFDGLDNLERLELAENSLGELPADIFDGLSKLEVLYLFANDLSALPDGVFDDLDNLRFLLLRHNDLRELPADLFDDLDNLEHLSLGFNDLDLDELPSDFFSAFPKLTWLDLSGIGKDIQGDYTGTMTTLSYDWFDSLSDLEYLDLSFNELSALPADVFDGFTDLKYLDLGVNDLSALPADVFDSPSKLEHLSLSNNQLDALPADVFDGLSSLEVLELNFNELDELPAGLFDGLSSLEYVSLAHNPGTPFTFMAELEQQDGGAVVVKVAEGAPYDMAVTLSAQGGVLSTAAATAATLTVAVEGGSITSESVAVTSDRDSDGPVTVGVQSAVFQNDTYGWIQTGLGPTVVINSLGSQQQNTPPTGLPTISGTAQVGETLRADTADIADADGLTGATFRYQWLGSKDTEIQGATSATYTLVADDEGKAVKVRVSFTDDAGNEESLTSAATDAVAAVPPPPPDNVRAVTQESGAVELTWEAPQDATVTGYRIERSRADENRGGQRRSDGRPRDNHTLVEDTGSADTGYTDKSAEKGVEYEYRVSARNEAGAGESSDWVRAGPESVSNSPATGAPTISGTAQVGETLTADTSGIADADGRSGETFTYQWVSSDGTTDTDIENATGSTYKLVDADQGKAIKVRVTFTDGGGNEETLTSAPTEPVLEETVFGDGLPGAPRNLTATAGNKEVTLSWDPPADNGNAPAARYRIEWRVDGKDYSTSQWGTSRSTTYTMTDQTNLANGVKYFFRVKAENDDGNSYGPYGPASEEVSATPTSGSAVDLGTPVLSDTETLHHGMVRLDWQDVEDAGWYVVQHYHLEGGEWLDLPAEGVDIAFHGSSAVVSNLHGLSWLRVGAASCDGASEWSQIEELYGTKESDWEGVPVPEVEAGDEIEPCPVVLGTPVLSEPENLHHGMVKLDWQDIEDAGWYVVQYYHLEGGEWLDLPAEGVDIAFHGSSAVVSNLHGLSWLRVGAASCDGASEWSQIEELYGTNASDWEGVPVPEVAEGDEIEPCSEDADTPDNTPATGVPTISGTAQVGETLTANTSGVADADGLSNVQYDYQWLADDAAIAGATGSTYTLADTDEGKAITVQVSFTDDAGNDETLTSEATDAVAAAPAANNPATGAPTISGTAQVGETLTADRSGIADADGLSNVQYEYQWLADDTAIQGATDATHTLANTEEGKAITVQVSFTDDADNEETLTSEATDAVAAAPAANNPATGAPTISGTAQVGETLTADRSGIADADGLSNVQYEYQWLADDTAIQGATDATHTLANTEEGKAITVQVSFTDDADNEETLTSAATDVVAGAQPTEPPDQPTGLDATASHDSVTLTWDDSGDDTITGYVVLRRIPGVDPEGQFSELVSNTGTDATTYTDDTVSAETRYTYRIKAINGAGTSERSRWYHIDTPAAPVPDKPTGLEATESDGRVVLTWDDPGDDSITGYVILRRVREDNTGGDFSVSVADTGTAATTYTDDTVAAGTTYTYRIKAINEHGTSERSRWFHIDIPAAP